MAESPLEQRLRDTGKRITPQRRLIASILSEKGRHLSADEIHQLARRQHARLSLATVYRTLRWLKDAGWVRELRLNGDHSRYEMAQDAPHQHLLCLECGKVIEFTCSHCADVHSDLASRYGFRITGSRVKLLGYCTDCQTQARGGSQ